MDEIRNPDSIVCCVRIEMAGISTFNVIYRWNESRIPAEIFPIVLNDVSEERKRKALFRKRIAEKRRSINTLAKSLGLTVLARNESMMSNICCVEFEGNFRLQQIR